jgi:hypothetical protein
MTATAEKPDSRAGDDILEGLIALQRRQIDTVNQITRIALHGARDVMARQSAAASNLHRQIFDLMSCAVASPAVADDIVSGLAFARQAVGIFISHSIALTEIATKMEMQALTILNKSASVSLDGISCTLQRTASSGGGETWPAGHG